MKKFIIFAVLVGVFLVFSSASAQVSVADRIAQLQAQIAALQEQIRVLQNQQHGSFCHNFNHNFAAASGDVDWSKINEVLVRENVTSVVAFQSKYGIPATGYVGPLTRAKLNSLYDCRNNAGDLVLSGTFGPTSLAVGETGIWKIFVRSQNNSSLNYQINWGDNLPAFNGSLATAGSAMSVPQESSFSHAYNQAGNYTISFTVSDNAGHQVRGTMSIIIRPQAQPGLMVLSPNGGENWVANSVQDIRWQTVAGVVSKVDLYLDHKWACEIDNPGNCSVPMIYVADWQAPILLDRNIDVNTVYHWIVATDINNRTISPGTYVVKVCAAGSQTNCDSSDHVFTINTEYLPSSGSSTTHN